MEQKLYIVVVSLVEHRLQGSWASAAAVGSAVVTPGLQSTGSIIALYKLSFPMTCGIFTDQGSDMCHLYYKMNS